VTDLNPPADTPATSTPLAATPPLAGAHQPRIARPIQALIAALSIAAASLAAMVIAHPDETAPPTTGGEVIATGETTEVTVEVRGMSYTTPTIEVPAGNRLVITFRNTGDQRHDLVLANGTGTDRLAVGAESVFDAGVITEPMEGWCSIPGHRAMGMELTIVPIGEAGVTSPDTSDPDSGTPMPGMDGHAGHHGAAMGPDVKAPTMAQLMDQADRMDAASAQLPPLTDATVHDYTFTVTESADPVAEGITREVWTYNGTAPGPTLHGRIGDTFRITLVNNGTMGHSVDFHAGEVAPDVPMRTIDPGQSLVYEFTASRSGIWMYHCGTMPMTQHIANGLFGAVVIEPEGLPAVDAEYVLIQSEVYLGANGGPASDVKTAAMQPDIAAFNGRAFQYVSHPLTASAGDRVRLWILNAGPSGDLSFHVVGAQFDTVWTEGAYSVFHGVSTDGATAGTTGAQTLPLMPAQGGFVEFVPTEPGIYSFVNHAMALAEKGAKGTLEVGPAHE